MIVKLLTEHHLAFLRLKGGCREARPSLHMTNRHIVGNLMHWLINAFHCQSRLKLSPCRPLLAVVNNVRSGQTAPHGAVWLWLKLLDCKLLYHSNFLDPLRSEVILPYVVYPFSLKHMWNISYRENFCRKEHLAFRVYLVWDRLPTSLEQTRYKWEKKAQTCQTKGVAKLMLNHVFIISWSSHLSHGNAMSVK